MDVVPDLHRFRPEEPLFTGPLEPLEEPARDSSSFSSSYASESPSEAEPEQRPTSTLTKDDADAQEDEALLQMMAHPEGREISSSRITNPSTAFTASAASFGFTDSNSMKKKEEEEQNEHKEEKEEEGPIRQAHRRGELWLYYHQRLREATLATTETTEPKKEQEGEHGRDVSSSTTPLSNAPPSWFYQLCWDLYHRTDSETTTSVNTTTTSSSTQEGAKPPPPPNAEASEGDDALQGSQEKDPYLFLPFELFDEQDYLISPFRFLPTSTYSTDLRVRLCLGHLHAEYVCFALAYPFPERHQLPHSFGTQPSRLWVDVGCHLTTTPAVFLQLAEGIPPALWLPIRPTAGAIRRAVSNFAVEAAKHRDRHQARWEQRWEEAEAVLKHQGMWPRSEMTLSTSSSSSSGPNGDGNVSSEENENTLLLPNTVKSPSQEPHVSEVEGAINGAILRMIAHHSRYVLYNEALPICEEHRNMQNFFLGEYDDVETALLAHVDLCPWLFAIPEMRCVVSPDGQEIAVPTIEGPGVAISLYRCRFSKALIQITVQLSAECKLPPLDMEAFEFMWKDSQIQPKLKIPVFARVSWPDHTHLSGGGGVLHRWNALFDTEFAPSMPVDAVWAMFEILQWARPRIPPSVRHMGVTGMRRCVRTLLLATHQEIDLPLEEAEETKAMLQAIAKGLEQTAAAASTPRLPTQTSPEQHTDTEERGYARLGADRSGSDVSSSTSSSSLSLFPPPLLYPGTAEIPNPEYTLQERLGMYLQYWAHLDDPYLVTSTLRAVLPSASAAVRMGCAKAALLIGDRRLFRDIVSSEPPGRMQVYMTKLVKKRKTRDLTDKVPRLLEDQYEFSAPLWTARHTRIDPNTVEGKTDLARLRKGK